MIVIFNTELEAINLANEIHEFLKVNRKGYNAERWSDLNKSDNAELWAVVIPNEYDYKGETIDRFPNDWRNEEELINE